MMTSVWDTIIKSWEATDLFKIIFSFVAGVILGAEREFKDKSAGLKTIATICLGSTLFTMLSHKIGIGPSEDATRIASYVVSGIGFLGAGVIFKDGLNVSGLTTASIIWMAAAIGMAAGFGEFAIAIAFLLCSILITHGGNSIYSWIFIERQSKQLVVSLHRADHVCVEDIENYIKRITKYSDTKQIKVDEDYYTVTFDIFIKKARLIELNQYLLNNAHVQKYAL